MTGLAATYRRACALLRIAILAALSCWPACDLDNVVVPSASNEITSFELRASDNPQLTQDVTGTVSDFSVTLNVPAGTDVTSLVPTILHNGAQITPASGEAQDFSAPVEYIVTAADDTERVYSVTVFVAAASSKEIRAFRVEGSPGTITGADISVTVPFGTDLTMLRGFVSHTGVSVRPADGATQDFSEPVTYTVTAQDGSTKTYAVTVSVAPSDAKDITAFAIAGKLADINGTQIAVTLPYGTDPRELAPTISHTGASVAPESGSAQDFRGPVTYTVTAADGTTQAYTVVVSIAPSNAKSITAFTVAGQDAAIGDSEITLTLPYGTDLSALTPFIQHTGTSVSPASGAPRDFNQPVQYTVTADDGSTKQYTVTLSVAASSAKSISEFVILGSSGEITGTTITLTVPYGTDASSLVPSILHDGVKVEPASGFIHDFREPVSYTVTAADGSTRTYTVIVSVAKSNAKEITQFKLLDAPAAISGGSITLTLPFGSDVSSATPQITHTGASIDPADGQARDFRTQQTYTVTAEDGSTRVYYVTVTVASSTAKDITQFKLLGYDAEIDGTDITLTLPYGSDVHELTPEITHTGQSIDPAEDAAQDFTEPVYYTVTAANSSNRVYTVHVTVARNNAKEITAFSIQNVSASVTPGVIALTLPFGTAVSALSPSIAFTGVSVFPASGTPQNFSSPVTYTVTAEDQSTKDYVVTVTVAKNNAKEITGFEILGKSANISNTDITLTLPYGTDPQDLVPTIAITGNKVEPASGVPCDFTQPVTFRVTAADDSYKEFTVTVTIAKNDAKDITGFSISGVPGQIGTDTITLTLPYGTDPVGLMPVISIDGESVAPLSNTPQDFSTPKLYTVTASDGSQKEYTVTVHIAKNFAKDILSFNILGVTPTIGPDTVTLTVPYGTDPAALTPTISISGVEIVPNSGVEQNFTNPVTYTVRADDGSTKPYTVTVTVAKNFAKDITAFSILGIPATSIGANDITLTVPYGTNPSSLTPTIATTGKTVSPASGTPNDFTNSTSYTVTAEDGTTKVYAVTVHVAKNFAKELTSFEILGVPGSIGANTVAITLPYGTDPASLTPTIASTGASVSPTSGTPNDFSNPAAYTVTAEDGTTKVYTVTVTVAKNFAKDITGFEILGVPGSIGVNTIALTVPYGTDPGSLTPTITTTGKTVGPASGAAQDFTNPVMYTVTAEDGTTKQYTVTVTVAKNFAKDITSFEILGVQGTVNASTVTLTVPYGTNPNTLTPTINTTGKTISPASGAPQDFSNPVTYTVTAEDGTTKQYVVTVTVAKNFAKDITGFTILGVQGDIGANSIAITLPYGTNPNGLTPTITSSGVSVNPASGSPNDFTSPATYVVTADDGTMKSYTVTVTIAKNTAKDITSFQILGETATLGANSVTLVLPYGTNLTSLTPTIAISGVSIDPASGAAQNFTNPVMYTVTADDGSTKPYTATVTAALNSAKDISSFSIMGLPATVGSNTVTLTVPYGIDLTSLTPTIAITGQSISPLSGVANNFSSPTTYTVTADNASTKPYTVTVTNASAPVDCREIHTTFPTLPSGTFMVDPDGVGSVAPFSVYCDMSNDGGGWTLIGKTAAGDYSALSTAAFVDLIANPTSDVNPSLLQNATTPTAGQIAFYDKAKTNALYNGSNALRAVRVTMTGNLLAPAANGTYYQQRVSAPANWDFWAALRNSLYWNRDGSPDVAPNDAFVKYFGTDVVLTNQASDFNPTTNVVTHRGDGTFGYFATYTHTLNDATTLVVSRHMGLLNDGVGNVGYMWLLTADPVDSRFKNDTMTQQKCVIWLR